MRLRDPIGIYLGSKTPPEIAASVMAEVLAVKTGMVLPCNMEVAQAKNERAVQGNDWPWQRQRHPALRPDLNSAEPN